MIYRVTVKTTGSVQPGSGGTFWNREVVYCGNVLEDARIAYLKSNASDYGGSYGNSARNTIIEGFESNPDDIEDDTPIAVEG